MNEIPGILDFLRFLEPLRGLPSVYIVVFTAGLLLILHDWRLSLLALLGQYLIAGLLFADVLLPYLAFVKVLVGMFVCLILYLTARQANWGTLPEDITKDEAIQLRKERMIRFGPYLLPTELPFRLFSGLMIILATWSLSQQPSYHLPAVPDHFNLAVFALIGLGLTTAGLTTEPLRAGLGLLTLFTGFELFYSALEQSTDVLLSLAIANLTVALVVAYLTQVRHAIQAIVD